MLHLEEVLQSNAVTVGVHWLIVHRPEQGDQLLGELWNNA